MMMMYTPGTYRFTVATGTYWCLKSKSLTWGKVSCGVLGTLTNLTQMVGNRQPCCLTLSALVLHLTCLPRCHNRISDVLLFKFWSHLPQLTCESISTTFGSLSTRNNCNKSRLFDCMLYSVICHVWWPLRPYANFQFQQWVCIIRLAFIFCKVKCFWKHHSYTCFVI